MLRISQVQFDALAAPIREQFIVHASTELSSVYAAAGIALNCEQSRAEIIAAMDKAQPYGISDLYSVVRFAMAMAGGNIDFDRHPSVRAALSNPHVPCNHRIDKVFDSPRLWSLATQPDDDLADGG